MKSRIEDLLRDTQLTTDDKRLILRAIAQIAEADGVVDPREREYLRNFVTEFFPEADPTDPTLTETRVTPDEVKNMSSDDARLCLLAFLTIAGYVDEDFSEPERKFIRSLVDGVIPEEDIMDIQHEVRKYLYQRTALAFVLRNGFLAPEFAMEIAERFGIPYDEAMELNTNVFNAAMALRGAEAAGPEEADG